MKESDIEQSLIESSKLLLAGQANRRLLDALLSEFGDIKHAFIVNWIPEQGEDIYWIAISLDIIAKAEVPRNEGCLNNILIEKIPFHFCRNGNIRVSKETRRKLSVVERILMQKNNDDSKSSTGDEGKS